MIRAWLTRGVEVVAKAPIFSLKKARRRHPEDGREADFFVIDSPDWVNVIAITKERKVVMVRQFRHGTDSITLEIPGGCVDPGEDLAIAAARELREETGYVADAMEEIGSVTANPAFMNNKCTTFLAHGAQLRADIDPDELEELEVVLHDLEKIPALMRAGEVDHAMVVCAFYHLSLRDGAV